MAIPPKRRSRRGNTSSGSPGWMTTLADMFMLLLTFFILMLSFSNMDTDKYRAMVTSLVEAFNMAPNEMPEPQGLADEDTDSPAISEDVPIPMDGAPAAPSRGDALLRDKASAKPASPDVHPGVEQLSSMLISEMEEAVSKDKIDVGFDQQRVVIRFNDEATFPVASAQLIPDIRPVVRKIVGIVSRCDGEVVVTGHTDNRPIVSDRYRSNWDLSAARAVSLVHELVLNRTIPAENVVAAGRAETQPIADNDTAEGREKNRRVTIEIYEPDCDPGSAD